MTKYELLEKLRKDLGYSRKKIGEILEVSPSTIEKYEKGRLDFNYKTKYILGICALAGYNNELFDEYEIYEYIPDKEIPKTLRYFKIGKYSSKIRQILYFLNIEYDEYFFFIKHLLIKQINLSLFTHKDFLNEIYNYIINGGENTEDLNKQNKISEFSKYEYVLQIILLYALNFFNPKDFYNEIEFINIKKILNDFSLFMEAFYSLDNKEVPISYIVKSDFKNDIHKLKKIFPTIKKTIEELMIKGKPVNKETIKEFKIELETGAIFSNCNQPTDPKDKQICELLQYAPPAFKDKIIEKLLQYKKDVEEF